MLYEHCLKESCDLVDLPDFDKYDVFVSAFNESYRVTSVFDSIPAKNKYWIVFPEYGFNQNELPRIWNVLTCTGSCEGEQIISAFANIPLKGNRICIDMTGFIRPQLIFLLNFLKKKKILLVDFIYAEPSQYSKKEKTLFSDRDFRRSGFCNSWPWPYCVFCVEVAYKDGHVAIRNSADPNKTIVVFTSNEWSAFVKGVKAGEFDFGKMI